MLDTYAPAPHTLEPTRLAQIKETIRSELFHIIDNSSWGDEEAGPSEDTSTLAGAIVSALLDASLIGLPLGDTARTSVRCDYVAALGERLKCRKGEAADDVLKAALARMVQG